MKAIIHTSYGPPDVLRYGEVGTPTAGRAEVLVRIHAASINFGDRVWLRGLPRAARLATGLSRPKRTVLGRDVAGTVAAVGPGTSRFAVGDRVFGELDQGGFAQYAAVPQSRLARIPDGVTDEQAAALPTAATTALQAVRLAGVRPGQTVLVNGASGGVGTFAVQLAKAHGAVVTGVCRTRNLDLVRSIGADHVIDHTRTDVTRLADRFDVVIDLAGSHGVAAMRRILTPTGVYVSSTGTGGAVLGPLPRIAATFLTAPFVRQRLRVLTARTNVEDLDHLARLVAAKEVTPVVGGTYPLSDTADAIRAVEAGHTHGKVVLSVP